MRACEVCDVALPDTSRSTKRFCSTYCRNRASRHLRVAWAKANVEATREINRKYRKRHPEVAAVQMAAYYRANREKFANARHLRRLRENADLRLITDRDWARLVARYRGRCAYCNEVAQLTRDHVIPVSRGGRHSIGNLVPACRACNGSKGARLLVEWRAAVRKAA